MLDVQCDQQGRDLLYGASVLKFARINPAHARNFGREIQSDCGCHRLVAAHQNIGFSGLITVEQLGRRVVECSGHGNTFRHQFRGLLGH